jgi:hypothetical protein
MFVGAVQRADLSVFVVVNDWIVDSAREVIFSELAWGAGINDQLVVPEILDL